MSRAKTYSAVAEWLIILFFGVLVSVPLVLAVTGPRQLYSKTEKRFLAKFPEFSSGNAPITSLTRAIDLYYQDHFGLREFLIHRYHREINKRFVTAAGPEVIVGKDGWLFYSGERMLDNLTGRFPLSHEQLEQLAEKIRTTRDWLGGKGISYLPMVSPDKQSIYPEYLPDFYRQARKSTRLDQVVAALNRDSATTILDLRPVLLRNKGEERLYDMTDTHWNHLGSYCGFLELLKEVASRFPEEDFRASFSVGARWRREPAGDLAQLSGLGETRGEMRPVVFAWLQAKEVEVSPALQEILRLEQLQPLLTVRAGKKLRVLVLHDSFMNPMKPFLSESFGEVLYLWKYFDRNIENFLNREVMNKVLAEFKPDLVIDQIVERHLDWLVPQENSQSAAVSAR